MKVRIHFSKGFFPLLISSLLVVLCLAGCAENSSILDNGQSRQLEFSVMTHGWNSSNSNPSDSRPYSRATPINTFDTSKNFNVIADVNHGGSWSTEVDNETASYSSTNKIWQTPVTHYWPGSGSTVNFYAYYPTSISGSITHTSGSAPVLSYTVPDNATDQIDILASSKAGVVGDSYNQTPVDFKHIFAAVQFKSGTAGLPDGTGAVLKIKSIQYKGTYTFGSGWTIFPDVRDLSQTVNLSTFGTSADITNDGETFMMLPQTFSNITIEITYTNGLVLSKTINGTWEAGKIYIYNLTKSITYNYNYTGNVQTFTVPYTGTYKIECWGVRGGGNYVDEHYNGAYTEGLINLSRGEKLYLYVGIMGTDGLTTHVYTADETFNGGGGYTGYFDYHCATGGGATDIRLVDGNWNNFDGLKSRIMVTAGAGGLIVPGYDTAGGTLNSKDVYKDSSWDESDGIISGSSQTSGYGFGFGQTAWRTGGGGGYYGGNAGAIRSAGGSSFISGYPGCNAISESSTSTNIIHTGSPNHYSGYVFTNMEMIAGDSSMPAPSGGTEIGHSGNGYARITFVSAN